MANTQENEPQLSDEEKRAKEIARWKDRLQELYNDTSAGGNDWLRILYSSYLQRFLSDNNRIWTTGQLMVPLAFAPFAAVPSLTYPFDLLKLLLFSFPSMGLIWLWIIIADNHRAFQEKSEEWLNRIEEVLRIKKPGGNKSPGFFVRPGMIRKTRWCLAWGITISWGLLIGWSIFCKFCRPC